MHTDDLVAPLCCLVPAAWGPLIFLSTAGISVIRLISADRSHCGPQCALGLGSCHVVAGSYAHL